MKIFKIILLVASLLGFGSCGIKGPPLPPLETVGERANNANMNSKSPIVASSDPTKVKK